MTWNHRVIKSSEGEEIWYSIHECYYEEGDGDIPSYWTDKPVAVCGESQGELLVEIGRMIDATKKPILMEKDGKLVVVKPD